MYEERKGRDPRENGEGTGKQTEENKSVLIFNACILQSN